MSRLKVIVGGGTSVIADLQTECMDEATDHPIYNLQGRDCATRPAEVSISRIAKSM